jgi:hypothetical protein
MSNQEELRMTIRCPCIIVATLTALTLWGCATMQNTPQQDYTYAMAQGCSNIPGVKLDRVEPDGRYWYSGGPAERSQFKACMDQQFKAHPFLDWAKAQKRDAAQPPVAVGSMAGVASAPPGPVVAPELLLQVRIGGIANRDGLIHSCGVQAKNPEIAKDLDKVKAQIAAASKAKIVKALHIQAQVPSVEIYAYEPGKEVLLTVDYSTLQYRDGADAETLVKLADTLCELR